MSLNVNDNDGAGTRPPHGEPDAHGQAALLLSESILHLLVETATVTGAEALAAVEAAAQVKVEVADMIGESRGRMEQSLALLSTIGASLRTDVG